MSETSSHAAYRITSLHLSERLRKLLTALGAQAATNAEFSGD
jgi:hypothetical protein